MEKQKKDKTILGINALGMFFFYKCWAEAISFLCNWHSNEYKREISLCDAAIYQVGNL